MEEKERLPTFRLWHKKELKSLSFFVRWHIDDARQFLFIRLSLIEDDS